MDDLLLSIIVPVYNVVSYLPVMLESLLAADLPDTEIVLVDDGSADESASLCLRYTREYTEVRFLQQEHAGPSAARNRGLRESNGKYVAFMDADDMIDPGALRRTALLLRDSEAQIWASDFTRAADNGCVLDRIQQIEDTDEPITDSDYLIHFLSDGERVWNVWRYIFQRAFLLDNRLFFLEGYDCAEDLEFVVRVLSCAERFSFLHNPYYTYRVTHGNSLTRQFTCKRTADLAEMLRASDNMLSGREDAGARLLRDKLVKEYLLNLSLLSETPDREREAAFAAYKEAAGLLKAADAERLKLACLLVRCLGLQTCSKLLLQMKRIKRCIRRRKIEEYSRS